MRQIIFYTVLISLFLPDWQVRQVTEQASSPVMGMLRSRPSRMLQLLLFRSAFELRRFGEYNSAPSHKSMGGSSMLEEYNFAPSHKRWAW